jgi:hypothetical protein
VSTTSSFGLYTLVQYTTADGSFTWTPPAGVTSYDVLVVAGGGGGGGGQGGGGGAGGAGGLLWLTSQSCTPGVGLSGSVGAGGDGGTASPVDPGSDGGNSVFNSNTATGGGGGGAGSSGSAGNNGRNGGSGGGGGGASAGNQSNAGTGTSGQGSNGGRGVAHSTTSNRAGGGGGGNGSTGSDATIGAGGNGGTGFDASALLGTSLGDGGSFASGGGGGSGGVGGTVGVSPAGGGGDGGRGTNGHGVAADANTGGGGGGCGSASGASVGAGGNGGSGVVIVRYVTPGLVLGLPTETDTARPLAGIVVAAVVSMGRSTEVDTALTLAAVRVGQIITLGRASETDSALAASVTQGQIVSLGLATETDAARPTTVSVVVVLGRATETDAPLAVAVSQSITLGLASEAEAPLAVTVAQRVTLGLASETDTARALSVGGAGTIVALGFASEADSTLSVTLTFSYVDTDTANFDDGVYIGDGYAQVVWEPDIVEPPFFVGPLTEDQVRVVAQVIDTAPGALPAFTPAAGRKVYAEAARDRVLINGVDMTYWNDAAAVVEGMKLIDPLLYGGCQITLPGINPQFPDAALGDLVERFKFARVKVQRVRDGAVISTDTKGFVSRVDTSGTTLTLEVAGEAAGALSQMYVPPPVFRRKQDVEHIVCDLLRDARVQAHEHDGLSGVGLIRRGGSDGLTIVNETIAVWAGATDQAVTFTPNANGVYRKTQKDATISATAYIDSSLISQTLAQDFAEQWTRVYGRGFTAAGEIVTNIKTPGLTQGDPPEFPGTLSFGDSDGGGNSVTTVQQQLQIHNFLDFNDTTPGEFDDETVSAVMTFQVVAGLTVTGVVNENTWNALWDLDSIGYSLDEAREYPMAQDTRTRKWFRTANGSKIRENPAYDPHFIPNDIAIDVGGPFGRNQIRDFARSKLTPDEGVWTGTLTFRSGLIWGNHSPGDPLTADDVMDRRDLLPNMRIKLPHFAGGINVYVAGVDHGPDETTCLVSTVPATTMEVWQAIERRREAKSNPGRAWSGHTRASQVRNDTAVQWDTSSGWIAQNVRLNAGWNEVMVPAGQSGIVQRIRVQLTMAVAFACMLTQKPVATGALDQNPLVDPRPGGDVADEDFDMAQRPWWERDRDWLDSRGLLDAWGTPKQPCGYDPTPKNDDEGTTGAPKTGLFVETAGFNYQTGSEPVLYLYVWVPAEPANIFLQSGRILHNQRTTDF